MAGIKAYPLFTLDKLINALVKHVHTINSDGKCQDLVALLEKDRAREHTTPRQQIAYRMEAEGAIGVDDALYRIEWVPDQKTISVQLLGKEDLTLDDAHADPRRLHSSWVASYALPSATEGVGAQVTAPVLKRNKALVASAEEDKGAGEVELVPGLEARVAGDSYQLLFVAGTEDFLYRPRADEEAKALAKEAEPEKEKEEEPVAEAPAPVDVDEDVVAGVGAAVEQVEAAQEDEAKAAEAVEAAAPAPSDEAVKADEPAAEAQPAAEAEAEAETGGEKAAEAPVEENAAEVEQAEEKAATDAEEEVEAEEEEAEAEEAEAEDVKETYEEVKQRRKERFLRWLEGAAARAEEAESEEHVGEGEEDGMEF